MSRILLAAALVAFTSGWFAGSAASAAPASWINCDFPHQRALDLAPVDAGPLTLTAVYCLGGQQYSGRPIGTPIVSPDASSIASYEHTTVLHTARLDGGKNWTSYQADVGAFATFAGFRPIPPFVWASDSQFIWTATHDKVRPSGFATSPMRPVRTVGNGEIEPLPELHHAAGPLDALLWAGGDGLAVAQFGTRGGSYRPEHDDPNPTFAIVDARRGIVLDSLPFDALEPLRTRNRQAAQYALVRNAAATALPDGRVRTLLSVGQWVVWTQGEAPRLLPDPYLGEFHNRMVLSPDGSRLLVGRLLRTDGGMCGFSGRMGGCRPGRPVEGVLAALHDLGSGRELWSIRATVTNDYEFPTPAISQDGRYALVGLVPTDARPLIALIAMQSGEIVQTLPAPGGDYAMGFVRDGRTVWTHAHGVTALYDMRTAAH